MKNIKNKINVTVPTICKGSGKIRFDTYNEANARAKYISETSNKSMKAYYCDECDGYHLTTLNKIDDNKYWELYKSSYKA